MKGFAQCKIIDSTDNRQCISCTQLKTSAIKCRGFIFSLSTIPKDIPFTYFIKKEKKDLEKQREQRKKLFSSFIYIVNAKRGSINMKTTRNLFCLFSCFLFLFVFPVFANAKETISETIPLENSINSEINEEENNEKNIMTIQEKNNSDNIEKKNKREIIDYFLCFSTILIGSIIIIVSKIRKNRRKNL